MEQYENNSLNNCTDNNEFHSQQPADADFKTPREEQPAGGAEATFSQSQPEESDVRAEEIVSQDAAQQSETGNEPTGAYHNAGAGPLCRLPLCDGGAAPAGIQTHRRLGDGVSPC